jgi:transposase
MTQEEEILFLRQGYKRLEQENKELRLRLSQLEALLKNSQDQLSKNSQNSSKPPCSDMFRKTQSLRKPSDKKPGGQTGHKGTTLEMIQHPDIIVVHNVERCSHCQGVLTDTAPQSYEKRQVYDLPPLKIVVTEHRCVSKTCPYCGWENKGSFPLTVEQPVQYGPQFKGLCIYLTNYQLLPYQRCAQLLEDMLGHSPCESSLVSMSKGCALELQPFEQQVKQVLCHSEVIHCDETGYFFCGKRNWLHVAATEEYTYYYAHEKRGKEALDDIGILPVYKEG